MRKLVYYVAASLDGFIAAPDGSWEFFGPVDPDLAAFVNDRFPETIPTALREQFGVTAPHQAFDTVVMGRGTYEPALAVGVTSPYAHLRQYVFSRTLDPATDPAVTVVADDPVPYLRELKQQPGMDIWLCGGGAFAAAVRSEIDEFVVKLNPVLAGGGVPLVGGPFDPQRLTLLDATPVGANGIVVLRYRSDRDRT
ncbi:dihydrofolate reductase family protein [Couchioplanes caeruleus]|uniref:Deaminase n=2 Tax=Couchioplanes caeruleus TaxID=56438 RepID=A0A1K0FB97_9ACTN|nr:dihydrofolate reductase family protein [Couchioplanes caeruleus]OJF10127.1 deaminase [Couchioplanes caeruleus subsp. caeruleus]ROP33888.1 dihydrofolate reductase [Couchioplanes caeruleus]